MGSASERSQEGPQESAVPSDGPESPLGSQTVIKGTLTAITNFKMYRGTNRIEVYF